MNQVGRGRWDRVTAGLARHPRWAMAAKAAAAAALAWGAVQPLGGFADDYPYYAPFGAVLAVSTTVARSLKVSVRSIAAILLGAMLAFAVAQAPWPEVYLLAIVVALGVVVGGWRKLGAAGEWVPVSALFVLVIGHADRLEYAMAYLVLTSLGAVIGIFLNSAMPPLPLTPVSETLSTLREILADQLDDLADGLRQNRPPSLDEWQQRQRSIDPHAHRLREVVAGASEARRVNWRARRWSTALEEQIDHAHALQRLVLVVEDLTVLVIDHENDEIDQVALGPDLRHLAAQAMARAAEVLRSADDDVVDASHTKAGEAIRELSDAIVDHQREIGGDMFAAGAIVIALRQILWTTPRRPAPRPRRVNRRPR